MEVVCFPKILVESRGVIHYYVKVVVASMLFEHAFILQIQFMHLFSFLAIWFTRSDTSVLILRAYRNNTLKRFNCRT